jgi:phage terminase large subunit-like protein
LIACARAEKLDEAARLIFPHRERLEHDWPFWARDDQLPPSCAPNGGDWKTWLILGGRGAGKTRAGAEWVRGMALGLPEFAALPMRRIALIGETLGDVRDVMIEGISGLLAVHPDDERPQWEPTRKRLQWKNGAIAQAFSAEDPESLRGPQFDAAWCDELCKWRYADATFDMLQFGLRLGAQPRQVVTTTPRPIALLKRLIADPATAVSKMPTRDNAYNLAPTFLESMIARYAGTRLGRQELDGEIVEQIEGSLFPLARIEAARVAEAPALKRIVVAIDPPASAREGANACGIVAAGTGIDDKIYVLADESAAGLSPLEWAARAVALYRRLEADRIVVEVNQGGDMVRSVIAEIDRDVPVLEVRATRAKHVRAEPVAALYEQGRVKHPGHFPALEDEMAAFGPDGLAAGRSPDRVDALVWAIAALMQGAGPTPRMRVL